MYDIFIFMNKMNISNISIPRYWKPCWLTQLLWIQRKFIKTWHFLECFNEALFQSNKWLRVIVIRKDKHPQIILTVFEDNIIWNTELHKIYPVRSSIHINSCSSDAAIHLYCPQAVFCEEKLVMDEGVTNSTRIHMLLYKPINILISKLFFNIRTKSLNSKSHIIDIVYVF